MVSHEMSYTPKTRKKKNHCYVKISVGKHAFETHLYLSFKLEAWGRAIVC